ncbi:MAG TPA: tRNA (adenosine(37)-N6)-dimethylallyltransferase MiaA, partial [Gemmatimonadaceae bacterium]
TGDSAAIDVGVICGPTAGGKSAIAMWLAERRPITIVSADSRQVYRGFDVGTAKPSSADRARVPHEGIDVVEPPVRYSSAAWADAANDWIADAFGLGRTPIVVGGTGLYLRALFEGLFAEPPIDAERRRRLEAELAALPTPELKRWVERLDPARARLGRAQLLRAAEIALLTGQRVSDLHAAQRGGNAAGPRWRPRYLLVDPGPALAQHIGARLDTMLNAGWPNEVERLMHSVPPDAPAWKATGYDAVRRLARDESTRADAREAILIETRQYAKRQRTWFRHQLPPDRVLTVNPLARDWEEVVARWTTGIVYGDRAGGSVRARR